MTIQATNVLHFCDKCGIRIARADVDTDAVRLDAEGKATCPQCARKRPGSGSMRKTPLPSASSPKATVLRQEGRRVTPHSLPVRNARGSERRFVGVEGAGVQRNRRLLIGGAMVVLLALVGGLLLLRSSDQPAGAPTALSGQDISPAAAPVLTLLRPDQQTTRRTSLLIELPPASVGAGLQPVSGTTTAGRSVDRVAASPTKVEAKDEPQHQADDYNPREMVARSLLLQAQQSYAAHPDDPWNYQDNLRALVTDHASTDAGKEAAALLTELKVGPRPAPPTGEQAEGLVLKPGLWARYYAGRQDNRRMKLHVTGSLISLEQNYGGGGPAPGVPGDNFETEAMGVLRISEPGEHTFIFIGDDFLDVWIDGKCIGNARWDRQVTVKVNLPAGDHPIRIVHNDSVSNSSFRLNWKRPGQKNEETIPSGALFHYGKPEEGR